MSATFDHGAGPFICGISGEVGPDGLAEAALLRCRRRTHRRIAKGEPVGISALQIGMSKKHAAAVLVALGVALAAVPARAGGPTYNVLPPVEYDRAGGFKQSVYAKSV